MDLPTGNNSAQMDLPKYTIYGYSNPPFDTRLRGMFKDIDTSRTKRIRSYPYQDAPPNQPRSIAWWM